METTGLDPAGCRVIELALVPFNMGAEVKKFARLFGQKEPLSQEISNITGITDAMLEHKAEFSQSCDEVSDLIKQAEFIVAYNARFDRHFVESEFARSGKTLPVRPWIDPFIFICEFDRFKRGKKLSDAALRWGIELKGAHRAENDAQAAGELLLKMADKIDGQSLNQVEALQKLL